MPATSKRYVDKAFGRRLTEASDNSRDIPEFNKGRYVWIRDQMGRLGQPVTVESIRKWYSGEARPRPEKMKALARVIRVDEGWLSLGLTPLMTPEQKATRNIFAEGSINLVAGMMQISGANIAFVDPKAPEAAFADFHVIMRGRAYLIKIAVGVLSEGKFKFALPNEFERVQVIGVVKLSAGNFQILRIPTAVIRKHARDRGAYKEIIAVNNGGELTVGKDVLPWIPDFETLDLAA